MYLAGGARRPKGGSRPGGRDSLARYVFRLLEFLPVGNWKQVQARIRKARTGADAPEKLEQLFLKTRDGMVAFELAKLHEESQRGSDALDWYTKAFERFRRSEWRDKAAEGIQRLGGTVPAVPEAPTDSADAPPENAHTAAVAPVPTPRSWAALPDELYYRPAEPAQASEEGAHDSREGAAEDEESSGPDPFNVEQPAAAVTGQNVPGGGKRRRRGRRGGRRHRKGGGQDERSSTANGVVTQTPQPAAHSQTQKAIPPQAHEEAPPRHTPPPRPEPDEAPAGWVGPRAEEMRTRAGDPGLASRVARLEMQIRRLLACPPHKVSEGDLAPAGPGVLLLSDSDLTTHYYICACDTLRIEISRLTRSDRGGRSRGRDQQQRPPLRARLAEHLEISDSQVTKYLDSHCVVRWLQLDEGAPRVAHFATAVLEPIIKE